MWFTVLGKDNLFRQSYQNLNYNDDDLIIAENTIYEIDMDCYDCLMKEKKRVLDKKSGNA